MSENNEQLIEKPRGKVVAHIVSPCRKTKPHSVLNASQIAAKLGEKQS